MRLAVIIFALVWSFTLTSCGDREAQYNQHIANGDKYCAKEEYRSAISAFKAAVHLKPKSADAHFKLGKAYENHAEHFSKEKNEELGLKFAEVNDFRLIYYNYLSDEIQKKSEEIEHKAKAEFEKVLVLNPNYAEANYELSSFYYSDEKTRMKYLQEAIRCKPEYIDAYSLLGSIYSGKNDNSSYLKLMKKLTETAPNNSEAYLLLMRAYERLHDYKNMHSTLIKWIEIDPKNVKAHFQLGMYYQKQLKNNQKALFEYREVIRLNPVSYQAYISKMRIARIYIKEKKFNLASKEYREIIIKYPEHANNARFYLYNMYIEIYDYPKLIPLAEEYVKSDPKHSNIYNLLGTAYTINGQSSKAFEAFQKAIKLDPDNSNAYRNLALLYYDTGSFDEALKQITICKSKSFNNQDIDNLYNQILAAKAKAEKESKQK